MERNGFNKAFSLVELMVSTAIICILSGLVLGTVGYMNKKALDARCQAQFSTVELAIESYKSDHGFYPGIYKAPGSPASSNTTDMINWYNDKLKANGSSALARSLVQRKNDFNKAYLPNGFDITLSSQNKYMVDGNGNIVQSSKAGSMDGAQRIVNPAGNLYNYTIPGKNNLGAYDLSAGGTLGKTYKNWGP
jgi:prepilin-type N-terminal cleavage/methylation domain-containing protein